MCSPLLATGFTVNHLYRIRGHKDKLRDMNSGHQPNKKSAG